MFDLFKSRTGKIKVLFYGVLKMEKIMLRSMSHRATQKLKGICDSEPYYNSKNLFHEQSKGYYLISSEFLEQALKIKGITKARSQNMENYGHCW